MWYLLSTFWFWLLLAAVLGVIIGWMTNGREGAGWSGLVPWGAALAVGGLVAFMQVLPQRLGYWFDLALLMLAAYVIGCCLALLLRGAKPAAEPAVEASKPAERIMPVLEVPVEPMKAAADPAPAEAREEAITGLSGARGGKGDDLTRIYGVDSEISAKLNALGLYHYDQIASLTPGQLRWLFRQLGHEGRFPSWWWRWRYDAERILAGGDGAAAAPAKTAKAKAVRATPKAAPELAPEPAAAPLSEDGFEGAKPVGLTGPREGKHDDLKRIRGIGKQNEGRLHGLGIWHFDQIAGWSTDEVKWVGGYLAFPGRIEREEWVSQAKVLATGGDTEFSRRADAGKVATSRDDTGDDGQANVLSVDKEAGAPPKGRKR